MITAGIILIVGLLAGAVVTQVYGYRLGGTVTIPVTAVYTLWEFVMLPVFLVSMLAAAVAMVLLRRRTLVYGREELVAVILVGSLVPLAAVVLVTGVSGSVGTVAFIGSVLPGLAVYNYVEVDEELRRGDLVASVLLLCGLLALGAALVRPRYLLSLGTLGPPVLFTASADIAQLNGAVISAAPPAAIVPRAIAVSLFAAGFAVSELLRQEFGVRPGIVVAVLVGLYTVANVWLGLMYVGVTVVTVVMVHTAHYLTLRYGRVLLAVTTAVGIAVVLPVTLSLPVQRGLSGLIVGLLAGVTAYNVHSTAPINRRLVLPLQATVFVPTLLVARLFAGPTAMGFPARLSPLVLVGAGVVIILCVVAAVVVTVDEPDPETVPATTATQVSDD